MIFLLLSAWMLTTLCSAQVYLTTGQTGANGKLPANWTVTPGSGTPASFEFGGGYFLMGVTAGYDYSLNVRATNASGALLGSVNLTAAQLCAQSTGCQSGYTNHTFTLAMPLTFSTPNSYYVELVGKNSTTLTPDTSDALKNPTSFSWVNSTGSTVDLTTTTAPGAPTGVTASAGNAQAAVSFTAPASNGGSAITSYLATATPTGGGGSITATCGASATSCVVTGLANGTSYNLSVQAQNIIGPGTATSASNNPITPSADAAATTYTFAGPAGGGVNGASTSFTVTPSGVYSGTITITPSGGGLSTPIVLTFSSSSTAQTFTITPTAVGPVTLTPSNNGSLTDPAALTYATPSAPPTIGTAAAGNGSISVAFTAPASTGGAAITGYTATCSPGNMTGTGAASPIAVTGLTNGTAYTCTVTATNSVGTSAASSTSNSVTPVAPATSFTFTGPTGGALNDNSGAFTVMPNAIYNGTITVTPSGGGLSTPVVLTFNNSFVAQTFTISPTAVGPVTLTPSNNGSLTNPAVLRYATSPAAPTIGMATAGNGAATVSFTPPASTGGSAITGYTVTCSPGNLTATGAASPITVTGLTNGTAYACAVTASNSAGTSASSASSNSFTPFVPASSYTFTGPAGGVLNGSSGVFTITPNAVYNGTITITPSGGGLSSPVVLTFGNSSAAQTFTISPTAIGPVTLTATNSGSLTNPPVLTYATPSAPPTIGTAAAGNGSISVAFTAPASTGGATITGYTATCSPGNLTGTGPASPITIGGATNGLAYACRVAAANSAGTSASSGVSNSVTPMSVPGVPLSVSAVAGNGQATVTFSPPMNTGGAPITSYIVAANPGGTAVVSTTSPVTMNGLTNGVAYVFSVTAANQVGSGAAATSNSVVPAGPPGAPTGVSAIAGSGQATVSFSVPASNGGAPILNYTVVSSPGGVSATGAASPLMVIGLVNGTAYTFSVSAANRVGVGPASSSSNGVTPQSSVAPLQPVATAFPAGVVNSAYPTQLLTANGGVAPYRYSISAGSLPPGISLTGAQIAGVPTTAGDFSFTITVTDAAGVVATVSASIHVAPISADLILSDGALSFALTSGAQGLPVPASLTVRSSIVQQLLNYTVSLSPPAPWLTVSGGGTTPGSIRVGLSSAALSMAASADAYRTTITVACMAPSSCAGLRKTVAVSLSVTAPPPAVSSPPLVAFEAPAANPVRSVQVSSISNSGGGVLTIQSVSPADSWISVGALPTSLAAGVSVPVSITADPTGLAPGYYTSSVTIATSAGPITIPVTLRVSQKPVARLAPSGAQFRTTLGGALGNPSGSFQITVPGDSAIHWRATVLPGSPWLSVTSAQGTASAAAPGTVNFTIDQTAIVNPAAQGYYGTVRVTSDDVMNSPVDFEVVLDVAPPAAPISPVPSPAGLVFMAGPAKAPAPQSVQVSASSSAGLTYQASAFTQDSAAWLSVAPPVGVASAGAPGQSSVSVNPAGLAPGVYRGNVSYASSSASVHTVNVTLIVSGSSATSCIPTKLVATEVGLVHNFQQPAGWPTELKVNVTTDCGAPVTDAQVSASFSNGDAPIVLKAIDQSSGLYSGTWTPVANSSQVTISLTATGLNSLTASTQITGQVTSSTVAALAPSAAFHIFWPRIGGALAPGAAIQIYGSNLASAPASAGSMPLPLSLGGTSVTIGGIPASLYYVSPNQIDAQVPFELAANQQYDLQVNVNGVPSATQPVVLNPAAPGIAAYPSGAAIAQHLDYSLVTDAAPLKPGEYVILYLAGLGMTDTPITTGAAAPSDPLVHPADPPVVTINGNPVDVAFAGLTPFSAGLYQINLQMPGNLPDGPAVVVVRQSASTSNSVTLPVQH